MKVIFKSSFVQDLKKVKAPVFKQRVREIIELAEQARNLQEMGDLRKLRGSDRYYRIRTGDHRIGLSVEDDTIVFVRFLHQRDIYRYFP